jgi:hypothetical protein
MPEARPQYGLPYQQLPATRVTPESTLNEQIRAGRRQIQNKYALQWKTVGQGSRFLGRTKTDRLLREIDAKAKQEMLQFNQQAQAQMNQLQNIDRLAQQGAIPNPDEIKTRIMYGADVARSMYPSPEKERTIPQQFGELDVYSHRISDELERFKEDKSSRLFTAISPLTTAISLYRGPKRKVKIWNPDTGKWEKAEPEEIGEYDFWRQQEKIVSERKLELAEKFGVAQRVAQPGVAKSGFDAGVVESMPKPVTKRQQPTSIELRQRGTREAYEQGKRLGYWN